MKPLRYLSSLAAILLATALTPTAGPSATPPQDDEPVVVQSMKQIGRDLRQLRRQVRDAANKDSALELISKIKTNLQIAQKEQPLKTPDLPESERAEFLKSYRSMLDDVIATVGKLEAAVGSGDMEQAQTLVRKLYDSRKEGHKRFQKSPDSE